MDQTPNLGNNKCFYEFCGGDPARFADSNEGLVNISVQLRSHVLTIETHRSGSLNSWRQEEVTGIDPNILFRVVPQFSACEYMEPARLMGRDELPPFVNGLARDSEGSAYSSLAAVVVSNRFAGSHAELESTPVDYEVNCSGLDEFSSGKRGFPLGYSRMAKSPRIKPSVSFNGDVIRELRESRSMSQERLAELIGTGKANVSKWERARSYVAISFDLFLKLAQALYVAPEELARRISQPAAAPPSRPTGSAPHAR